MLQLIEKLSTQCPITLWLSQLIVLLLVKIKAEYIVLQARSCPASALVVLFLCVYVRYSVQAGEMFALIKRFNTFL